MLRVGLPGAMMTPRGERVDFGLESERLGHCRPRLVQLALEAERARKGQMRQVQPWIGGPGLSQQVDCLVLTQIQTAPTQYAVKGRYIRVVRTQAKRLLDVRDCRLRLAEIHQGLAQLEDRTRMVRVERDRSLVLDA